MVCGETEVAAANLRITLKNLKKKGGDGLTGFQRQMQVHVRLCNYTQLSNTVVCISWRYLTDNRGGEFSPSSYLH